MTNCRLCRSGKADIMFQKYSFGIAKCKHCDLIYTDLNPNPNFFSDYYSKDYFQSGGDKRSYENYQGEADALQATFRKRLTILKLATKGAVLDIGCAYGYFLTVMPKGWSKFGVEVSTHAAKFASKLNKDAKVINGELTSNTFNAAKFDLITLWDVIEHLPDPLSVLQTSYRLLKKGGKIALTTGDVDSAFAKFQGQNWHLYNPPQHLSYFSTTTIIKILKKAGFKKISVIHPSAYYPLSYLLHKLKNLYHIPLPQYSWTQRINLPVNLSDIMLVTAVK